MPASAPTFIRQAWYKWKSLSLPWRRRRLIGWDLKGHTYWEMVNDLDRSRPRRLVQYPRDTHPGDVHLTPAWLQWLRHTRHHGPSIQEQLHEVQRQEAVKELAARADERWNSKESYLDAPDKQQPQPLLRPRDEAGYGAGSAGNRAAGSVDDTQSIVESESDQVPPASEATPRPRQATKNPFDQAGKTPGEAWQPQAWQPGKAARR